MSGVTASVSQSPFSFLPTKPKNSSHSSQFRARFPGTTSPSDVKLTGTRYFGFNGSPRSKGRCSSSTGPGGSGSGDSASRTILDAFFLGKALGEALTERIESTIGEVLGGIGMLQAEQQRLVLEFQKEVIDRAKKAKDKAARDAVEIQKPISNNQQPSKPEVDSETPVNQDPALGSTNVQE